MATWTGQEHAEQVFKAAVIWKQRCLLGNQCLFSDLTLWTRNNFEELKRLFVDNPILGKGTFYGKLQQQIGNAKPDICKLAAEALWVLYLFVANSVVGIDLKRKRIGEIWSLSKETLPDLELLQDDKLKGLANPGIAFLAKICIEIVARPVCDAENLRKRNRHGDPLSLTWAAFEAVSITKRVRQPCCGKTWMQEWHGTASWTCNLL